MATRKCLPTLTKSVNKLFGLTPVSPESRRLIAADWIEELGAEVEAVSLREGLFEVEELVLAGNGRALCFGDADGRGYSTTGTGYGGKGKSWEEGSVDGWGFGCGEDCTGSGSSNGGGFGYSYESVEETIESVLDLYFNYNPF